MWTKSACVRFALSIVLIVLAAGIKEPARPVQANTRNANRTLAITVTSTRTAGTPLVAAAHTAATTAPYLVQPGDTLSGIAARFGLPGGWRPLYAANRTVIGPDPNVIRTGTVLALPGPAVTARYQIAPGDTLSGVAARFGLPGAWQALYAANRAVIGPDPDVLRTRTLLATPGKPPARSPTPHPGQHAQPPPRPTAHPRQHAHQPPRPTAHSGHRAPQSAPPADSGHTRTPVRTRTPGSAASPVTAMPAWLDALLAAVGLLIGGAFLLHLIMAAAPRRRKGAARAAPTATAPTATAPTATALTATAATAAGAPGTEAAAVRPAQDRTAIVMADYDRLIVTHSAADDTVYVLRPPG